MKPVYQQIIHPKWGDCMSACFASLFDLNIDDVPKFMRDADGDKQLAMLRVREWLLNTFGLAIVSIQMENRAGDFTGKDLRFIGGSKGMPCMAGGKSKTYPDSSHAVCGEVDGQGNFTLTHDPNPNSDGLDGFPQIIYVFVPMDLSAVRVWR